MGQTLSVLFNPLKRMRSPDSTISLDESTEPPKKKTLPDSRQYIYQTLFVDQKDSDVDVMALDKVWHLHKVYLCQSPYFSCMFNGNWIESRERSIRIEILDDQITTDSLNVVFGAMYSADILILPENVISVVATATLFQLQNIIDCCVEVMQKYISDKTATQYYDAACRYAVMPAKESTIKWFLFNVSRFYKSQPNRLRHIPIELMTALAASPDVHASEYELYSLLRTWMFLRLHPDYNPEDPERRKEARAELTRVQDAAADMYMNIYNVAERMYFTQPREESSFLATPEGEPYMEVFNKLRIQHLTSYHHDLLELHNDSIIPKEWLHSHMTNNWAALLRIDHGHNPCAALLRFGYEPDSCFAEVTEEEFFQTCMRLEYMVGVPSRKTFIDFKFGLDLVMTVTRGNLAIRRYHEFDDRRLVCLKEIRQIMIRATVASVSEYLQPIFSQRTEVLCLDLPINKDVNILTMDSKHSFPMVVHLNMLVVPIDQAFDVPPSEAATAMIAGQDVSEHKNQLNVGDTVDLSGSPESS